MQFYLQNLSANENSVTLNGVTVLHKKRIPDGAMIGVAGSLPFRIALALCFASHVLQGRFFLFHYPDSNDGHCSCLQCNGVAVDHLNDLFIPDAEHLDEGDEVRNFLFSYVRLLKVAANRALESTQQRNVAPSSSQLWQVTSKLLEQVADCCAETRSMPDREAIEDAVWVV